MFSKWEYQFEEWKRNNMDNPDRQYVDKYIHDMNTMKNRLLERRKTLQEKVEMENAAIQQNAQPSSSNYGQK